MTKYLFNIEIHNNKIYMQRNAYSAKQLIKQKGVRTYQSFQPLTNKQPKSKINHLLLMTNTQTYYWYCDSLC